MDIYLPTGSIETDGTLSGTMLFHSTANATSSSEIKVKAKTINTATTSNSIVSQNGGFVNFEADNISLLSTAGTAVTVFGSKADVDLNAVNGDLTITSGTGNAISVSSTNGSVTLAASSDVTLDGGNRAINATGKEASVTVAADEAVTLKGVSAAVYGEGDSTISITAPTTTVTAAKKGFELSGSELTVNGNTDITTTATGGSAYGIYAKGGTASFNGDVTMTSTSDKWSYGALAWGGAINLGKDKTSVIDITLNAQDSDEAMGLWAYQEGSKIDVKADKLTINVNTKADALAYGIIAQNTTYNEAADPASITIDANETVITMTDGENPAGSAIAVMSDGIVNIAGNLTASAENVILARGNASAEVNVGSAGNTTQLEGNINFNWAASSGTPVDANVNVVLDGADSKWDGSSLVSWSNMPEAAKAVESNLAVTGLNVTLSNGAVWTPVTVEEFDNQNSDGTYTGQKALAINTLTMEDGVIAIESGVDASVEEIAGSGGEVHMTNADDLGSLTAAKADGVALQVSAINEKGEVQTADEVTPEKLAEMVAQVKAEGATVTAYAPEGDVEGGTEVTPEQPGQEGGNVIVHRNTLMDSALQIASVNTVALDKILTNDVRKRLGDIRSDKNTSGLWMRWDGGKLKGDAGVTNDFNTIQIGGDTKVGTNCRVGVAGSFTHGDSEFARGIAELEGFSLAAYATWMGENGMFADVVARLGHFSNEMKVEGRTGDTDSRVASLSGEYGWRFDLCKQFFIEPQVELAYTYVSSDDLQLGTAKYAFDSVNSLTGRAGAVFGWNLPNERGNLYARASVVQQFLGDAKISGTNGEAFNVQELDGNDTWLEYGIGANVKLTDKTYLWADIERTEGASIEEEWRGTVGVRFSF